MSKLERKFLELKLTDGATKGIVSGYGAVFGNEDAFGDVIEEGAFAETLKQWKARGKLPPMLLQHGGGLFGGSAEDMVPIGKWDSMIEDSTGLKVEGHIIGLDTDRGIFVREALSEGVLDGLSIGFRVREQRIGTQPGEPGRTLTNVDLWELSLVTFPANPQARVTSVKNLSEHERFDLAADMCSVGMSYPEAVKACNAIEKFLARIQNKRDTG